MMDNLDRRDDGRGIDCAVCGTPLVGVWSFPFRVLGIRPSQHNPRLCNRCDTHIRAGDIAEVTVLFADLSAFSKLTHDLGPERAAEVVHGFLGMASEVLARHDAFIDKYLGDGVMAVFNAPIRRTDHAVRAVRAAEALREGVRALGSRLGLELNAQSGIAGGWVRLGRVAVAGPSAPTAIGEAVNLAARLEEQARPGEIMVDSAVYAAVAAEYPGAAAEILRLKGFTGSLAVHRLLSNGTAPAPRAAVAVEARPYHLRLGALVFAVLGAPCAAAIAVGPLAAFLGAGSLFGAASAVWIIDRSWFRVPVMGLSVLGSAANLYVLWHAWALRRAGRAIPASRLERRRGFLAALVAVATFAVVAFEVYAHRLMHAMP